MRTTLDIEDDVLLAAKELAKRRGTTAGRVLSDLARQALQQAPGSVAEGTEEFLGFRPFTSRGGLVTNELIDSIREDEGE